WSTGQVPTAADDVVINRSGGNPGLTNRFTITVSGNNSAALSITSSESIVVSGQLSVTASSAISGNFTLASGQLNAAGTVTLSGNSTWNGATITGTVLNNGVISLNSGDHLLSTGAKFINKGTAVQVGGRLAVLAGSIFQNDPTGVYDLKSE